MIDNSDTLISRDMHKNYNGIYLTDFQVSTLQKYGFSINKYRDIKMLMYDLENELTFSENPELESILDELSEFDYYHNTNK